MIATVLAAQSDAGLSNSIVFIPEGESTITPSVNGKPKQITVRVNAENGQRIAAKLNADLEKRLAGNVRPFFDFDHKDVGPAAAIPKRLSYEPGKGIMAEVDWTGAGESAIKARDYSYFSPVFLLGANDEPAGLPERGPLGALVNDPAFRDIPRIAAASAGAVTTNPTTPIMNELVTCGLLTESEAAKENAGQIARARVSAMHGDSDKLKEIEAKIDELTKERDAMKEELDKAKTQVAEAKQAKADQEVKAAVADGRIAAKDEETQKFYIDLIVEKGDVAVKALNALAKQHEDITTQQVIASASSQTKGGSEQRIAAAQAAARKELGDSGGFLAIWARAAEIDPKAFEN